MTATHFLPSRGISMQLLARGRTRWARLGHSRREGCPSILLSPPPPPLPPARMGLLAHLFHSSSSSPLSTVPLGTEFLPPTGVPAHAAAAAAAAAAAQASSPLPPLSPCLSSSSGAAATTHAFRFFEQVTGTLAAVCKKSSTPALHSSSSSSSTLSICDGAGAAMHSSQQLPRHDSQAGLKLLLLLEAPCKAHTAQNLQHLSRRFFGNRRVVVVQEAEQQQGRWRSSSGKAGGGGGGGAEGKGGGGWSWGSGGSGSGAGFVAWYLKMLEQRPLLTKSLTASFILTSADLAAQGLAGVLEGEGATSVLDLQRTARMATIGLLLSGPTLHLWFHFLSWAVPKRDVASVLLKIVIGQTTYGPAFNATFFSINGYAQGESADEIVERLRRDLLKTILNGLLYWPVSDFLMFRYVPVHLQPLWVNTAAFFWTIYIAYVAGSKPPAPATALPAYKS